MSEYHPERYWSEVADRIKQRQGKNVIAGDDEPYYRYKRKKFLQLLHTVDFQGKSVLEIGCGPGGNLLEVWKRQPAKLAGADISSNMVDIARENLPSEVNIHKVDGKTLPFEDETFDLVFTATVLQHNTDEEMLKRVVAELARVSKNKVILFERIEKEIKGDELCYGRPVTYYQGLLEQHGFELAATQFINIQTSYYVSGAIRKGLNPSTRVEGEPLTPLSTMLQRLSLPVTSVLDKIFTSKKDLAKLEFVRKA